MLDRELKHLHALCFCKRRTELTRLKTVACCRPGDERTRCRGRQGYWDWFHDSWGIPICIVLSTHLSQVYKMRHTHLYMCLFAITVI